MNVQIEVRDGCAVVRVADNGRGLDPAARPKTGRLGPVGLRERAALISGTLELESTPGQGTTVVLSVPLDPSTT